MAISKKHSLSEMIRTGIIGEVWPKVGYVIVIIKDDDGSVIFVARYDSSDHKGHAEMKMLSDQDFLDKVKTGGVDIIVTSNYSPCWECTPKLIKFYTENESSIQNFTIRFAHPYKTIIKPNEDCLKDLHKAGIKLEAMTEKSWFDVIVRLMFGLEPGKVRIRDRETRKQLEGFLHVDPTLCLVVLLSMVEESQDVLSRMLSPGQVWSNDKYLMITVRSRDGSTMINKCYGNSDHEHAVTKLLKDPDVVKVESPYSVPSHLRKEIILTFNYWPCPTCAADLIKLYRDNKGLIQKFTIQFSCLFSKSQTNEIFTTKDALQKLNKAGITLEAMTEKSWFDLAMLFMFGLDPNKVRNRDKNTQETLEELLQADSNVEGLAEDIKAWSI